MTYPSAPRKAAGQLPVNFSGGVLKVRLWDRDPTAMSRFGRRPRCRPTYGWSGLIRCPGTPARPPCDRSSLLPPLVDAVVRCLGDRALHRVEGAGNVGVTGRSGDGPVEEGAGEVAGGQPRSPAGAIAGAD